MKQILLNFLKGFAIGAANVIPGVSGGTIALITGIFQRLINSIKSFDIKALRMLFTGKIKKFLKYTDFIFLMVVLLGVGISIITFAKILSYLFINYPIFIWAYFFGLILASVWFVGKTIDKWSLTVIISFVIGVVIAVSIILIKPANANSNFWYLFISGVVAICSMILPGLSGSFILILMGEYELILNAVNSLTFSILIPVALGSIIGLIAFSHFLSWIYKKYKNQTISLLTGFILGSLAILWPWKFSYDKFGNLIPTNQYGAFLNDSKVFSYKLYLPKIDTIFLIAIFLMILGFLTIYLLEKTAVSKKQNSKNEDLE